MIRTFKYIAISLVVITVLIFFFKIRTCESENNAAQSITVPADSNFAPVTQQTYTPPSIPFLSKKKFSVKLPQGVGERDLKKIIDVTLSDKPKKGETISIIETKDGSIYIAKDSSVKSVVVTKFEPPIMSLQIGFGVGLSLDYKCKRISPAVLFAPIEWLGWLHIPIISADLDGIGIGAQARLYHDFFIGAANQWRYDDGTQVKFLLTYNF